MSGGHFDYAQYHIDNIANSIEQELTSDEHSLETKREMQTAILTLRVAHVYTQRIDWLLSGDDGEATFHERLKNDLTKIVS